MEHRLFRLISMLWVGSLLSLGFVAAPVIFSTLNNTTDAGTVAAQLFCIETIIGALILIGYFGLQPFMNSLRVAAQEAGTDLANSPYAQQFGILHGMSSAIYVIESLFGIALVWRLPGAVPTKIVPKSKSAKMAAKRARS
ncbi:putative transmembrane protein [Candidatus Burkholderia brachyanthoides]|nr:putative transmembrane protein [Candidatus Burkholderia brachyanthoides]